MYLVPAKVVPKKNEQVTLGFKGLNRLPVTEDGELTAMTNASGRFSPALTSRPPREVIRTLTSGTALFPVGDKFCWVDGTNFVYDGVVKGTVTAGKKSTAEYFGIILIFPDKKYYNYVSNTFGDIQNCPDIQYVCVFNNRAFGCGGNGFYASKLNDPLTWNYLPVPITDDCCWQVNTGEPGDFKGIISTQSAVFAVKEGFLYRLFNDRPSNFLLKPIQESGCIDGDSLANANGLLFMLGNEGIKVCSGSSIELKSLKLNEKYVSGAAGTDGRFYYVSLYNGTEYNLYVCDSLNGYQWVREDNLHVLSFARMGDELYALAADNKVYRFNSGSEIITWSAEMEFTENYLGKKIQSSIKVGAELSAGSSLSVYYSLDGGDFKLADSYNYFSGYRAVETSIIPERCDKFKIKLACTGDIKIYELSREVEYCTTDSDYRGDVMRWDDFDKLKWDEADKLKWSDANKYEL